MSHAESPVLVVDQPGGNLALDLFVLTERVGVLLDAALEATGLSASEYAVYSQLAIRPLAPSAVSETLGIPRSTLSGYLKAMERRGDIHRERDRADGRSWVITLTDQGRGRVESSRPAVRRAVRAVNAALGTSAEVHEVRVVLGRIDSALRTVIARL